MRASQRTQRLLSTNSKINVWILKNHNKRDIAFKFLIAILTVWSLSFDAMPKITQYLRFFNGWVL